MKPTVILRHRRENLKKCSLRSLEGRPGFAFYTYPVDPLPDLTGYLLLKVGAPPLTEKDAGCGIFLIDATWRLAQIMEKQVTQKLYRNCLKNREFGTAETREAGGPSQCGAGLQNSCSEGATAPRSPKTHRHWGGAIAERLRTLENSPGDCFLGKQVNAVNWPEGGASENENFEVNPTQLKPDSSDNFGIEARSLPSGYRTAYPRKQTGCPDPESGLSSIEAIYLAHRILGREDEGLMSGYYWKDLFFEINSIET